MKVIVIPMTRNTNSNANIAMVAISLGVIPSLMVTEGDTNTSGEESDTSTISTSVNPAAVNLTFCSYAMKGDIIKDMNTLSSNTRCKIDTVYS